MRIETLKKKLHAEFNFEETLENLDQLPETGTLLFTPSYREKQRLWIIKAYNEWIKGNKTIVLVAPLKLSCRYFKKYVSDVAEIRPVKEFLTYNNNHRVTKPMMVAIYNRITTDQPNFTITFD
jgi:hypothetical protein